MRGIDLTWAGGEHNFALPIGLLRALQQRCDAGPQWVLMRLQNKQWHVDDVVSTIRLGLEGGGLAKTEAARLTREFVEDRPLTESVLTAYAILAFALYGGGDEADKKDTDPAGEPRAAAA
jgi:hypothetical protein